MYLSSSLPPSLSPLPLLPPSPPSLLPSPLPSLPPTQDLDIGSGSVMASYTIKTVTPTQTGPDTKLGADMDCKEEM